MKKICLLLLLTLAFRLVSSQSFATREERLEWWRDARFGMFIHWGPVSLKGEEISWSRYREIPVEEYDNLYRQFNPVNFDADAWVSTAKAAGMKYIVLTSKHHDGFCLWDTRQTSYNITNTPFKRDVVQELAEACRKQGIAMGLYYSTCDWHHPDFPMTGSGGRIRRETSDIDRYTTYLKRQVAELLVNYGPLACLWFDVPQEFDSVRGQGVIDFVRTIQPDILINNRTGAPGDFDTPEQKIGKFQYDRPWETCMTLGTQWAWKPDDKMKSLQLCLHSLIRSAGGNGNLLFNAGPMPDGRIEQRQADRLKEMGDWLSIYGETIYGTRGGPFKPSDWGVSTRKGNKIYIHILDWQGKNPVISIPDIGKPILSAHIYNGEAIKLKKQNDQFIIEIPSKMIHPIDNIIELEMGVDVMDIAPVDVVPMSVSFQKTATASSCINMRWNNPASVVDGDYVGHAWKPLGDDKEPWIEIDLGDDRKISKTVLYEAGNNVKQFEIQYKSGEKWITAFAGKIIGEKLEVGFPAVVAQNIRLLVTATKGVPSVYEIVILP